MAGELISLIQRLSAPAPEGAAHLDPADGERVTLNRGRVGTWAGQWRTPYVHEKVGSPEWKHRLEQIGSGAPLSTEVAEFVRLSSATAPEGDERLAPTDG